MEELEKRRLKTRLLAFGRHQSTTLEYYSVPGVWRLWDIVG